MKSITLITNHSCNLSCDYCFQDHSSSGYISIDDALQHIKNNLPLDMSEGINIIILGGEPLLLVNKLRALLLAIQNLLKGRNYRFSIISNGYLIKKNIDLIKEFKDNLAFSISIHPPVNLKALQESIGLLNNLGISSTISFVISSNNIKSFSSDIIKVQKVVNSSFIRLKMDKFKVFNYLDAEYIVSNLINLLKFSKTQDNLEIEVFDLIISKGKAKTEIRNKPITNLPHNCLNDAFETINKSSNKYPCSTLATLKGIDLNQSQILDLLHNVKRPDKCKSCLVAPYCELCMAHPISLGYITPDQVNKWYERNLPECSMSKALQIFYQLSKSLI